MKKVAEEVAPTVPGAAAKRGRGAPRKNKEAPNCVTAQLTPTERALVEAAAEADGRSISNFLKMAMVERAFKILGKE